MFSPRIQEVREHLLSLEEKIKDIYDLLQGMEATETKVAVSDIPDLADQKKAPRSDKNLRESLLGLFTASPNGVTVDQAFALISQAGKKCTWNSIRTQCVSLVREGKIRSTRKRTGHYELVSDCPTTPKDSSTLIQDVLDVLTKAKGSLHVLQIYTQVAGKHPTLYTTSVYGLCSVLTSKGQLKRTGRGMYSLVEKPKPQPVIVRVDVSSDETSSTLKNIILDFTRSQKMSTPTALYTHIHEIRPQTTKPSVYVRCAELLRTGELVKTSPGHYRLP